jgi:membrane protein YqaA with SNARE-associated domain
MRLFAKLYQMVLRWSRASYAPWYLGLVSFAESSLFIVPPDTMLAPMALAQPERARQFALITTVCSVLGGILGYCLGHYAFDLLHPLIVQMGYEASYLKVLHWFTYWGFWAVFVAGFAPIPYKVFTITAGVFGLSIIPFLCVSMISRGLRFFAVAELMRRGGKNMEEKLHLYIDRIAWIFLALLTSVIIFYYFRSFHA